MPVQAGPTQSGSSGLMVALGPLWARWDDVIQAGGLAPCEPLKMSLIFWGLLLSALLQRPLQVKAPIACQLPVLHRGHLWFVARHLQMLASCLKRQTHA